MTNPPQSFDVVKDTLMVAWRPKKCVDIKRMRDNMFLFQFLDTADCRTVLKGIPWLLGKGLKVKFNDSNHGNVMFQYERLRSMKVLPEKRRPKIGSGEDDGGPGGKWSPSESDSRLVTSDRPREREFQNSKRTMRGDSSCINGKGLNEVQTVGTHVSSLVMISIVVSFDLAIEESAYRVAPSSRYEVDKGQCNWGGREIEKGGDGLKRM
ncbi:hypothetical protein LguiB_017264 [Lonicera macranthoides]